MAFNCKLGLTQMCFSTLMQELEGYGTQVLDLGGKVVVPGFIDSHVHFIAGGFQLTLLVVNQVQFRNVVIRKSNCLGWILVFYRIGYLNHLHVT